MTLKIRRVVTGHSAEGRARVEIDEKRRQRDLKSGRRFIVGDLGHERFSGQQ
jgi:hypothetical protein